MRVVDFLLVMIVLELMDDGFEWIVIFAFAFLDAHDDVAVHLNEAAVTIPGEALVLGRSNERLHRLVVEAKIQNRVHHARHGITRSRPHRYEQRHLFGIAEFRPHNPLHIRHAFIDLGLERRRIGAVVRVIVSANFGRDRESRRDRQTDPGHLGEVRAFAAEQRFHLAGAVSVTIAEVINVFRRF